MSRALFNVGDYVEVSPHGRLGGSVTKGLHFQRFYIDEDWSLNDEDLKED